jgi:lipopolysaccharide transport system ATP-binding protein
MGNTAVRVVGLGKRYRIGLRQRRPATLRETISRAAAAPFSYAASLLRLPSEDEILWALKDVSFEVPQGAVVGIIGRNGAGKSTLLKILSRITEPTEGYAELYGRVGSLLEVGTGFHPELTGRENIYLSGTILGMTRSEVGRKFDQIVDFSGIERFIDTPVKRYSSGMYVRLAFAVAAHLEPEILLVDEVLAVGDVEFQQKCLGKMSDVAGEGRTVLFVSHNMSAVRQLCETAMLLDAGMIHQKGSASECVDSYLGRYMMRKGTILQHMVVRDPIVQIIDIHVNATREDVIYLESDTRKLEISFGARVLSPCMASVYAYLKSANGDTLGVFSPGHMQADLCELGVGKSQLTAEIELPLLNKGHYYLDFGLAVPGVRSYVEFPNGLEIIASGIRNKLGTVFEEMSGAGYQVLTGSNYLQERNC